MHLENPKLYFFFVTFTDVVSHLWKNFFYSFINDESCGRWTWTWTTTLATYEMRNKSTLETMKLILKEKITENCHYFETKETWVFQGFNASLSLMYSKKTTTLFRSRNANVLFLFTFWLKIQLVFVMCFLLLRCFFIHYVPTNVPQCELR